MGMHPAGIRTRTRPRGSTRYQAHGHYRGSGRGLAASFGGPTATIGSGPPLPKIVAVGE